MTPGPPHSGDTVTGTAAEDRQQTRAWEALVAARQSALDSLIFRFANRYSLKAGEIGALRSGMKDWTEERIITMHQILDRGERDAGHHD